MIKPNEPAFSRACGSIQSQDYDPGDPGLTKREYFAALALQGLLAGEWHGLIANDEYADKAVRCADALIVALNAEEPKP